MRRARRLEPVKLEGYKPLREIVFESLRDAIISGVFEPGERLMEVMLADELGVSRTPVREAIRRLELEGFAIMVPRRGAYVSGISIKDIHEVFEIRAALEELAARLAARRITVDELEEMERQMVMEAEETEAANLEKIIEVDAGFHNLLYKAARNERLSQFVSNLQEQFLRFRTASLSHPGRSKTALDEHKEIVEALAERDEDLAAKLAKEHIENAENTMVEALEKDGFYTGV